MNHSDIDDDTGTDDTTDYSMPDPFVLAIELCKVAAKPSTYAAALKKLGKLGRDIETAERKLSQLQADAAAIAAKAESDASAIAEQSRALDAREAAFASSLQEAHAALRASHDNLSDVDRRLRYRILSHADLLHGFNSQLQDLPTWPAIRQMIPGLPDDLPAAPPAEVVSENVREDWAGSIFTPGSSLTRTVRGASGEQRS
jgi:hypothetical protein